MSILALRLAAPMGPGALALVERGLNEPGCGADVCFRFKRRGATESGLYRRPAPCVGDELEESRCTGVRVVGERVPVALALDDCQSLVDQVFREVLRNKGTPLLDIA